jgi:hypothetical protein
MAWKVDVISMSFKLGKDANIKEINKMLVDMADKVLMFAAASNSGPIEGRAYPAKRPEVIAVHAAYGNHEPYGGNPYLYSGEVNFGTLGTFVPAAHKGTKTERLSGTSVACAVAAGIAALVLEFCRQSSTAPEIRVADNALLKRKSAMLEIFKQMRPRKKNSAPPLQGSMVFLQPWELLNLKRGGGKASTAQIVIAAEIVDILREVEEELDY